MKRFFNWILRRLGLYVLLVLALAFATFAWPQIQRELEGGTDAEARYEALVSAKQRIEAERLSEISSLQDRLAGIENESLTSIERQLAALRAEKEELESQESSGGVLGELARGGQDAVVAAQKRKLRIALLDREIASLSAARAVVLARRGTGGAGSQELSRQIAAEKAACRRYTSARQELESSWQWSFRQFWESDEHRNVVAAQSRHCREARNLATALNGMVAAEKALDRSRTNIGSGLDQIDAELTREAARAQAAWQGSWRGRIKSWAEEWHISRLLWQAAWLFLLLLVTPYLIRILFYFVLAPLAERRPRIRLRVPGGAGTPISLMQRSATSVHVELTEHEELLVRQGYLQTTAIGGTRATRWLLDWHHPLSNLAAGLHFLTQLSGPGLQVTISAVNDPLSEVAEIELPAGASCVLHPRALAAVAQLKSAPLRITSHWRIFSLNAWLTQQLRYLVFHGPARLTIKGGRGVRVESAQQGRVFGQDQLIGFSADLAYSVTRTETFWPYFLGREQLLKDKVERGEGILIVEETPLHGRPGSKLRHGLEGTMDALMKAVGL